MDENLNNGAVPASGGKGSLIGAIIVVIILIIGAIYLLSNRAEAPVVPEEGTATTTAEVTDLEAAAGAIDLTDLETEAEALDEAVAE